MIRKFLAVLSFALLAVATLPARAADDPSLHDIYTAAEAGRLDEAQTMIGKVLADHPESWKAHYVAAELDSRQGKLDAARSQLAQAEKLSPGLTKANADSVRALRAQLGVGSSNSPELVRGSNAVPERVSGGGHSSLMTIGIVALVVFVLYMIFRRRQTPPPVQSMGQGTGNPYYGGAGGGYAAPPAGGGIGSGVAGGLATGLAVGAGVVAGEALAHRLAGDGREHERYGASSDSDTRGDSGSNSNMGGNDFGVSDSSSWDDSSGGDSGGGGDDWS